MSVNEDHFKHLARLMALEAEAEKQETLQYLQRKSAVEAEASGNSLTDLVIREEDGGLGGRILISLGKRNQTLQIPWTRLRVGTPIILSEEGANQNQSKELIGWRGVVSRLNRDMIQVALTQWLDAETDRPTFRLDRSGDEFSRRRQSEALALAQSGRGDHLRRVRDVLLGQKAPVFQKSVPYPTFDEDLNESQKAAIYFALTANDVALIHGPPGTGKTTTVVALIDQLVAQKQTVLACAPSNMAVDNLLEKLVAKGIKAVRLGHPARVQTDLQAHTLDALVENHPDQRQIEKLRREAYALRNQAAKYTRAKPEPGSKQAMRQEAKQILADTRRMEDQIVERLLEGAEVLCVTLTGLDRNRLGDRVFDWCIVDEAGQSTEPESWVPLAYAKRFVLAGDHCQLPPTVISPQAAKAGFNISLLERLITQSEAELSRLLTVQYRMHQDIAEFASQSFYEGRLESDPSVAHHVLSDLPHVTENDLTETPIHFIDTAGASYDEALEPDGESRLNPLEAELILKKCQDLAEIGVLETDMAIITPYAAQVRLLRQQLGPSNVEVDTVDGFQGREKEAILISLVRSNPTGEIGFLGDVRRMNVALTRARRKLIVVGDSATITTHPFYEKLIAYFEAISAYHSVWEEM
ncbi:MAG: AAA domain-containing protein [Chloroflexota bacterium]